MFLDITNKKFSKLTALKRVEKPKHISKNSKESFWLFSCDCGNKIISGSYNVRSGHTTSCGCYQKEVMRKRCKEKHQNWNPNLTKEDRIKERSLEENQKWINGVYELYNYTCQSCNNRGGKLVAHHKNGYHWFKEGRFDLNNGICFCKECHDLFHLFFGKKDNTTEQVNIFLKEKNKIKSIILSVLKNKEGLSERKLADKFNKKRSFVCNVKKRHRNNNLLNLLK